MSALSRARARVRVRVLTALTPRRSHICFELLKNSLRAVVERFGTSDEARLPPIKVVVIEGNEDITIKISDEGGGIPRSAIPLIWTYMYTTMEGQSVDPDFETQGSDFKAPMAGFGYGLPLSRLVSPGCFEGKTRPLIPSIGSTHGISAATCA